MIERIYFFIKFMVDLIPGVWRATKYKNVDVSLVYCDDDKTYDAWLMIKKEVVKLFKQ